MIPTVTVLSFIGIVPKNSGRIMSGSLKMYTRPLDVEDLLTELSA
ncbi:MAG: hypothetical protein U5J63_05005 [Fodinibius sp.]|nr:hypothetical protein [Fodinibius sp.]